LLWNARGEQKELFMKTFRNLILGLVAAMILPQIAGAKLSITPQSLGFIESTLDYCAKVDSESAAQYKERGKAFIGDATQEELDKARSTAEYKDSYSTTSSNLEKTKKSDAVKACKAFLEGK